MAGVIEFPRRCANVQTSRSDCRDDVLRAVCRAVIERVATENPGCSPAMFEKQLQVAAPFRTNYGRAARVWREEVARAVKTAAQPAACSMKAHA